MIIHGWIAAPAGDILNGSSHFVFARVEYALNHAREQARKQDKPWAVYKIGQSHHLKPQAVVVTEADEDAGQPK